MIDSQNRLRIHTKNFKELFPNAPMGFEKLLSTSYPEPKTMRLNNTFNTVRFLYINDIIMIVERAINTNNSPYEKHKKAWKKFLETDLFDANNNEHERIANSD